MLVLTRRKDEWIDIPEAGISILVCEIDQRFRRVKLGVVAPDANRILRREVLERMHATCNEEQTNRRTTHTGRTGAETKGETGTRGSSQGVGSRCPECALRRPVVDGADRLGDSVPSLGSPASAACSGQGMGKPGCGRPQGEQMAE